MGLFHRIFVLTLASGFLANVIARAQKPPQDLFRVKYISEGTVYLDAGRNAGLKEGLSLYVVRTTSTGDATEAIRFRTEDSLGELKVLSVADLSSVCEIVNAKQTVEIGDLAYLTPSSSTKRLDQENKEDAKNYPVVITFTDGDPLDEEIRETTVPHKMSPPEDTQIRGRIG